MPRCAVFVVVALLCVLARADPSIVNTANGPVQGNVTSGYRSFLGIPFAQPPVGDLRWSAPQPASSWSTPLDCTNFRDACAQECVLPQFICPSPGNPASEDCLYLNVWTPPVGSSSDDTPLPVMVFIPGGAFEMGTANSLLYEGTQFVTHNVVLVTVNYRLGALGFMVAPGMMDGNYGFQDQILALQWVNTNIAAFGGDPTNVTLFGESAGGSSVGMHLVISTPPLFQRVIMESNPLGLPLATPLEAAEIGTEVAVALGCVPYDVSCLRSASADDVVAASNKVQGHFIPIPVSLWFATPYAPIVDGTLITDQPINLFESGNFHQMPTIIGTNENEGVMFVYGAEANAISSIEYDGAVAVLFGVGNVGGILSHYPMNGSDARPALSLIGTDYMFACPSRRVAEIIANTGQPTYLYHFDHVMSFNPWGPNFTFCVDVVCHGSELPFVFGTAALDGFSFTSAEQTMSNQMDAYWAGFAIGGDPNYLNMGPEWPQFNNQTRQNILLTTPITTESNYNEAQCDFWDTVGYTY